MWVVYIVTGAFVTALLLALPLFPFWKVWTRLRRHHPDIWRSAGPFELYDMLRSLGLVGIFINVIVKINRDKPLQAADPALGKWARACVETMRMVPRAWGARILALVIFFYLVAELTARLV